MIKVSNIQRFSIHDGPGIRTTVFFKGCNLRCAWCHNPETFVTDSCLEFYKAKCTGCGICERICPQKATKIVNGIAEIDRALCNKCMRCVENCPNDARENNGMELSTEEIFKTVIKDKAYYDKTGGGITLSGGEPLSQYKEAIKLLKMAKDNGITTALETALNVDKAVVDEIFPYVDYFMCDIKAFDTNLHKRLTGVGNDKILSNIKYLSEKGADMLLRIPMVPTLNDSIENMRGTAEFIASLPSKHKLELLRFHSLARDKYASMDMDYKVSEIEPPNNEKMEEYKAVFEEYGIDVKIS